MGTDAREPPGWFLSRRLFLCGLALVHAIAFGSLATQVRGLFGEHGIVPIAVRLEELAGLLSWSERWQVPTLFWLGASDGVLAGACLAGIGLAGLVALGILPRLALFLLWAGYLSFVAVGYPFLNFQWDALLLEAGLLAIFLAPGGVRPFGERERPPAALLLWLVRWLLFRLLFLSGLLKLTSGDSSWWDLTALDYHYWTQPLPHRLSHLAHVAPEWVRKLSVLSMFAIELGAPFLALGPRRCRELAAALTAFLMAVIFATGNYGFFNLLTAVLAIPLVDDRTWRVLLRRPARAPVAPVPGAGPVRRAALGLFALAVLVLTSCSAWLWMGQELPRPLAGLQRTFAPLVSFNGYGLFRSMTRERPEIVLEGSLDGVEWRPYPFRYKPLEPERAPVFAGLHMPRLDWQMWFAALAADGPARPRWYADFLVRLLQGSPDVLALLDEDPFPGAAPRYLRSTLFRYRFTSSEGRRAGLWWARERVGEYFPAVELMAGELRPVR